VIECIFPLKRIHWTQFCWGHKSNHSIPIQDPTVWLDRARHANACIPPSFHGKASAQSCVIPNSKIYLRVQKIAKKIQVFCKNKNQISNFCFYKNVIWIFLLFFIPANNFCHGYDTGLCRCFPQEGGWYTWIGMSSSIQLISRIQSSANQLSATVSVSNVKFDIFTSHPNSVCIIVLR
jgi:hypothetical protein